MTELGDSEQSDDKGQHPVEAPERRHRHSHDSQLLLMAGALGVVYGDIGTSPLYSVETVFSLDHDRVHPDAVGVYGIVSLIFWSITLVVSLKYVVFVMRADNDGEGGVMALAALVRDALKHAGPRRIALVMALGLLGGALFYGDSVITPAISVMSAMEGLKVDYPSLGHLVLPLSVAILVVLFVGQKFGTSRVGVAFGPVMALWFVTIAAAGLREVVRSPRILRGLSPSYAAEFIADRPYTAFVAMGAVVLAITGAEALYADMGHFGRRPIRRAWFLLVFPALTLNYLAQGALILHDPSARANPFFRLMPHWAQIPSVVLAAAATVIASQAVISGAFSMTRQALRLGFLPHLRIRQTSERHEGQIYIPAVNWILLVAVVAVAVGFGSSARLATAYGVAVTGTFLITTMLLLTVARARWHWPVWRLVVLGVLFVPAELTFFAANLSKVAHGGWLTLLIAAIVFTVMSTWQRGRGLVTARRVDMEGSLTKFLAEASWHATRRVPGVAVFPHPNCDTAPLALRANVRLNQVRHQNILIVSGRTANVPHVPWEDRLTVTAIGPATDRITHIESLFGFQDDPNFPAVLQHAAPQLPAVSVAELEEAVYFVSRVSLHRDTGAGMATWRKALFVAVAHNATSQVEFLGLPDDRTIVLSADVRV